MSVLDRFLRYVRYDTRADEASTSYPSTPGQLVLLRDLAEELRGLGLADVTMDAHGYVMGTVPATTTKTGVPTIGFIAHIDTSPEMSGTNVEPIVHRAYDGRDLVLPHDPTAIVRFADNPDLAEQLGHDIVTASGTTLLGSDDKAGVAEIVTAAAYLMAHPEIPHGPVRVGFTPDEEIGRGTLHFDLDRFGAFCAFTLDGGKRGEVEHESFCADGMTFTFVGFNMHAGYAKDRMVNAIKVAATFIASLPRRGLSPETTSGREGFVHPYTLSASVERTAVRILLRDFTVAGLDDKAHLLNRLAAEAVAAHAGSRVDIDREEQYRNMRLVLDNHPQIVEFACEAVRRAGLEVHMAPIRGGTDGSKLSFMGLPTPNLFAGEHNFHSRLEWVSVQDMEKAVETIVHLCRIFEERTPSENGEP
jgi:tripeptide aminopeptidase